MIVRPAPSDALRLASTSFTGFTFAGEQRLDALARFYGLATPALASQVTLAQYLTQLWRLQAKPGRSVTVGGARLVILKVAGGAITKVGLDFRRTPNPRPSPEAYTRSRAIGRARFVQGSIHYSRHPDPERIST